MAAQRLVEVDLLELGHVDPQGDPLGGEPLQPGPEDPLPEGIAVQLRRDPHRTDAQLFDPCRESLEAVEGRVEDELRDQSRVAGDHLHQHLVPVARAHVDRVRTVDQSPVDPGPVHGVDRLLRVVDRDGTVVPPAEHDVSVERRHGRPEMEVYLTQRPLSPYPHWERGHPARTMAQRMEEKTSSAASSVRSMSSSV